MECAVCSNIIIDRTSTQYTFEQMPFETSLIILSPSLSFKNQSGMTWWKTTTTRNGWLVSMVYVLLGKSVMAIWAPFVPWSGPALDRYLGSCRSLGCSLKPPVFDIGQLSFYGLPFREWKNWSFRRVVILSRFFARQTFWIHVWRGVHQFMLLGNGILQKNLPLLSDHRIRKIALPNR